MPTPSLTPQQLLNFYSIAEKLKSTLRHSWLSEKGRQESVAEHTWMMTLLALILLPQLEQSLDVEKVLKMIIVHDLAEAITADMPVWQGIEEKSAKMAAEKQAMATILESLDSVTRRDLLQIWEEYEIRESSEARFVKALDTLDVIAQHNMAPIESWDDNDYLWQLSPLQHTFFDVDPLLKQIKKELDNWSIKKADDAENLSKLDQVELEKREKK